MEKYNTIYFEKPGNNNIDNVIKIAAKAAKDFEIKKIVIFSARLASVLKLKKAIINMDAEAIVATYAFGREFNIRKSDDEETRSVIPEVATKKAKDMILKEGIKYVQGGVPFEPIISCTGDNSTEMIISTLDLFSNGLSLCVNASIMAYENGYVDENESIICLSGDTAIVVKPTIKRDLFSGKFKLQRILCKPL